jgi:hypothetical protein
VLSEDVQAFEADGNVMFTRLAVTPEQIEQLGLPSSAEDELIVQAEAMRRSASVWP